jgi:prephenate dehydrogenase
MFSTLTIVGVGLIGGSLGLAAKKHGVARRVIGVGRNEKGLARALQLGVVDEITTDVAAGVRESELVVVCTPVEWIAPYVREVAAHAPSGTLITDAGSTKEALVKQVEADLQRAASSAQFVGSHPMAGSEKNGADHGRADLFERRVVIVTPAESSQLESVERICAFWRALGARVEKMSPAEHDRAVASISHVPHVIAAALAAATPPDSWPLVAGGWLDTTRIAAGSPELWRQILAQNRSHTLKAMAQFEKVLAALRDSLETENDAELLHLLQAGKNARDAVGSRYSAGEGTR